MVSTLIDIRDIIAVFEIGVRPCMIFHEASSVSPQSLPLELLLDKEEARFGGYGGDQEA